MGNYARCEPLLSTIVPRLARRLKRWNRMRTAPRGELNRARTFCFLRTRATRTAVTWMSFQCLGPRNIKTDGYNVDLPSSADALREMLLSGEAERLGSMVNVAYRMNTEEYRRLCPYVDAIEGEWGRAPGRINSFGNDLLIQGITLGNIFVGVQPTFGFEGDPMRLMMPVAEVRITGSWLFTHIFRKYLMRTPSYMLAHTEPWSLCPANKLGSRASAGRTGSSASYPISISTA